MRFKLSQVSDKQSTNNIDDPRIEFPFDKETSEHVSESNNAPKRQSRRLRSNASCEANTSSLQTSRSKLPKCREESMQAAEQSNITAIAAIFDQVKIQVASLKFHQCQLCDKSFLHHRPLVQHMTSAHKQQRVYLRPIADKMSSSDADLFVRMDSGSLEPKPFEWRCRDSKYIDKQDLEKHIDDAHANLKPWSCSKCDKCFKSESVLKKHVAHDHRKVKKYACQICGNRFLHVQSFRQHARFSCKRNIANDFDAECERPKMLSCDECGRKFRERRSLRRHITFMHLEAKFSQCNVCGRIFTSKESLNRHIRAVHFKIKQ